MTSSNIIVPLAQLQNVSSMQQVLYCLLTWWGFFPAPPVLWSLQHDYFPLKTILKDINTMTLEGMGFHNKLMFERK